MSELVLETARSGEELEALADGWDELVLAAPRPSPFLLHGWLGAWWRAYGEGRELAVHVARRDGRLVAALPLCTGRRGGVRVTTFVGGAGSALGDLLLAPGEGLDSGRALVERARESPGDYVDLFGLPGGSRISQCLGARELALFERVEAPVLDLNGGWDAVYRAKTSAKRRNLHGRRRRQLAEQGGELAVRCARGADELDAALDAAFELHELRWQGRPDGSGFATPLGRRFNREAMVAVADAHDAVRIVTLELDGRPVAFHYYFALAGRMVVYRLAFDPALGRFSPGLVNTLDAIEAASEEGLERVEFLGGDERYKLELADRLEPLHQGIGLAATPQGRAAAAAQRAAIASRRRLKRSDTLRRLYVDGLAPARRLAARARRLSAAAEYAER